MLQTVPCQIKCLLFVVLLISFWDLFIMYQNNSGDSVLFILMPLLNFIKVKAILAIYFDFLGENRMFP